MAKTRKASAAVNPKILLEKRPRILLALTWYAVAIHRGIARYARQAGWALDLSMARDGRLPHRWRGDGIISLSHRKTKVADFIRRQGCPAVNIGVMMLPGVPIVRGDDAAIGRLAADHFLERGFRHIAFCARADTIPVWDRCEAMRRAVEAGGGAFYLLDWCETTAARRNHDVRWLGRQLSELPKPLGILAGPDEVGIEVMEACIRQGLKVPEEVAILGVDNDALRCDFAPVPLSSVDNNQEMEGYEAAALLDRLLRKEPVPDGPRLISPIGVVVRQSTDILAVEHPHVATALRHIAQNFTRPINAKTVAATVPISYRNLHDAFQRNLGRSLAEEITRRRLEQAKHLLVSTRLRLRELAQACGFPGEARLCVVFRRELGLTPIEYRRQNRGAPRKAPTPHREAPFE